MGQRRRRSQRALRRRQRLHQVCGVAAAVRNCASIARVPQERVGIPSPPRVLWHKTHDRPRRSVPFLFLPLFLSHTSACRIVSFLFPVIMTGNALRCLPGRPHESRNRCFRLLGSSKFGKSAALRVAAANQRPLENMIWRGKGGVLTRASSPQPRDVARTLLVSKHASLPTIFLIQNFSLANHPIHGQRRVVSVFGGHCVASYSR